MENLKTVSVNDLDNILEKIELIDIRDAQEYKMGHVKSAKNIPMRELLEYTDEYLSKDKEYHIICHSGMRSKMTCDTLANEGFHVVNVLGGTMGYAGALEK